MKKSKTIFLWIFFFVSSFSFFCFYETTTEEVYAFDNVLNSRDIKNRRLNFFDLTKDTLENSTINILIVPGHDDEYYGTEFGNVKEVDLNRELAKELYNFLNKERGFNPVLVSDENGYNQLFLNFFRKEKNKIRDFIKDTKKDFYKKIKDGSINIEDNNVHNVAPEEVAYRLYGINYWADKQKFDLVIHVHFNDYAGRHKDSKFKYSGFSIYIPDEEFKNYDVSFDFANKIFNRLKNISSVSDLEQEKEGVIPNAELIAVGSNESLRAGSMLIEYGYIYEPQFTNNETQKIVIQELARQTYFGVKDFFGETVDDDLNYKFEKDLYLQKKIMSVDNFMLQYKLKRLGFYPPSNKEDRDCPVNGLFGSCTQEAVKDFQLSNKIKPTGYVGKITRGLLSSN